MAEENELFILRCGNCTPLGPRSGLSATGVRAGFSMISLHPDVKDENWEPIRLGTAGYISQYLDIEEQFYQLALPAFEEVISFFRETDIRPKNLPVLIGYPEPRPGLPPLLSYMLLKKMPEPTYKLNIPVQIEFIHQGHAACLGALEQAGQLLEKHPFCVIGGVDSYNERDTLKWLEYDVKRLFCSTNRDGFIPGQGAGFILLASRQAVEKYSLKPRAKVLSVALNEEKNSFETDTDSSAAALTLSIRKVLEMLPGENKANAIYSAMNGETYNTREFVYAIANVGSKLTDVNNIVAPYDCWGDLGAATVPVLIGLLMEAAKKNYEKGPMNLITAASLGNLRASALIELITETR